MRNIILFIMLISIVSIISTSGCINNQNNHNNGDSIKSNVNCTFRLSFRPNYAESYYLIVPCPMYNNSSDNLITNELNNERVSNVIEETEFGKGINISSDKMIQISFVIEKERDFFNYWLSMQNGTTISKGGNFYCFSTVEGIIEYDYSVIDDYNEIRYEIDGKLISGWQEINGTVWMFKN